MLCYVRGLMVGVQLQGSWLMLVHAAVGEGTSVCGCGGGRGFRQLARVWAWCSVSWRVRAS